MAATSPELKELLERHRIALPDEQVGQLQQYCQLLWQWNERLNLTRHTDYEKFVTRDLVDTMHLAALLEPGQRILDVGTGGGVPGVVLAILRPDLQVSVCESVGKKAQALDAIVSELQLPVTVYQARAEHLVADFPFDVLTCRAIGPLWKICKWFAGQWSSFGRLLAIKGPRWVEERGEARHRGLLRDVELRKAATYETPGAGAENVILSLASKGRERE